MTIIVGIDPGPEVSGIVYFGEGKIVLAKVWDNHKIIEEAGLWGDCHVSIEGFANYGMAIGQETINAILWSGRIIQACPRPEHVKIVYRKDVKMHLCGSMKAKDANVRQALIDILGPQGTKKNPGPTYGVSSHAWSALAIVVTALGLKPKLPENV